VERTGVSPLRGSRTKTARSGLDCLPRLEGPSIEFAAQTRFKTVSDGDPWRLARPPKRGLPPMHPGALLREEILPALDRSKTEIGKLLERVRRSMTSLRKSSR